MAHYYGPTHTKLEEQLAFEKILFTKTHRVQAEIAVLEGNITAVYMAAGDMFLYVCGSGDGNELILVSVLNALNDSLSQVLGGNPDKRSLLESLDVVMLVVDELVDNGVILETDPDLIVHRASLRANPGAGDPVSAQGGDLTLSQAMRSLRETLPRNSAR